jgi:DNA-binding PadR family transcriptional regulator
VDRISGGHQADISSIMVALRRLEERGVVTSWQVTTDAPPDYRSATESDLIQAKARYEEWLVNTRPDDLAVDEVGLWYEITDDGFSEWRDSADPDA